MNSIFVTDTLTVKHCPVCHIQYAAPASMFEKMNNNGGNWFCPNGHSLVFRDNKLEELEKKLKNKDESIEWYQKRNESLHTELTKKNHTIRAEKAAKTKLKKRISNGVCPCCTRSFQNLSAHMKHMHPDFVKE